MSPQVPPAHLLCISLLCYCLINAGYGSLICPHSRSITVPEQADKVATPVLVQGIQRQWAKRTKRGMTAMGIHFVEGAECVGVLLPVNETELRQFDEREQGYDRVLIDLDQVDAVPFLNDEHYDHEDHSIFLNAKAANDKESIRIWVYVQQEPMPPTIDHPIAQSYVDTILRGCLHISEEFAVEFIQTTKGWHPEEIEDMEVFSSDEEFSSDDGSFNSSDSNTVWVDDRKDPIYIRGDPEWSLKKAPVLDRLLRKHRPSHFQHRQPLSACSRD